MDPLIETQRDSKKSEDAHSEDYAPYPKLDPKDITPPPPLPPDHPPHEIGSQPSNPPPTTATSPSTSPQKSVRWSAELTTEAPLPATTMPAESNPYVTPSPVQPSSKNTMESVKGMLSKWGKKVGEATKKGQDYAGNVWQHLKTGPSMADAALGRLAQGTKVIAEGGYEKIFRQTFDTLQEEQLQKSYACYLSTSAGPVMGILYLSTAKLAFCSDNPLSYKAGDQTEWSYYKVVIPLHQLKAVNSSASKINRSEKYIQIVSVDGHEFWFMGFVNYDSAVKHLQEALQGRDPQPV